jgi:endonuclease/exonuclease/phosphatase family metal-dependent hydrolase
VIVTGDFNAGEESAPIRYLTNGAAPVRLVDTFRVIHPRRREVGTRNRWKGRTSGPKIDSIFIEPETKVLAAETRNDDQRDGRYPSDHLPVSAHVNVPERP